MGAAAVQKAVWKNMIYKEEYTLISQQTIQYFDTQERRNCLVCVAKGHSVFPSVSKYKNFRKY